MYIMIETAESILGEREKFRRLGDRFEDWGMHTVLAWCIYRAGLEKERLWYFVTRQDIG